MKNKHFLTIIVMAIATTVSAQQSEHDNYVGVNFGGGLNTMLYKTANGQQSVGGGIDAGLFYGHFFNRTVGLGVGLNYTWANAYTTYNWSEVTPDLIHPSNPNQHYDLYTTYTDWKEQQTIGVLSIPVEVLFRKALNERWAFIGGVGVSVDFPLHGTYSPMGGTYATTGVFPKLGNYTVSNLPEHGFDTYTTTQGGKIGNMAKVGASVIADLGFRMAFNSNWGMYLGAYFGYGFTNLLEQAKTEPMVIINDQQKIDYTGTFGSNETNKANLLRCGLKIAFDFGWPVKAKEAAVEEIIPAVNEDSIRQAQEKAAREARFAQYKQEQQAVCAAMAEPDDSEACKALIAKAQQDIAALQYDHNLSEEENKARVDAIREQLAKDLAALREKEAREKAEQEAQQQAERQQKFFDIEAINVYFENGGAEPSVSEDIKELILELCRMMQEDASIKVVVYGHTDSYGDPEQNLRYFGMKRAEALKAYMVKNGAPADNIRCESKGQTEPIAPNDTRANRAKNRRANIRFE